MKKLLTIMTVLTLSYTQEAKADCQVDPSACSNTPYSDVDSLNQQQTQAIQNSNTAVMQQQMYLSAPIGNIPVSSMGKDGEACAGDFAYISAGASRAKLSGVPDNAFGNGSWAAGVQVGKVFAQDNNACLSRQKIRLEAAKFTTSIEQHVHCLNYRKTALEQGLNPVAALKLLPPENELRTVCTPIIASMNNDNAKLKQTEQELARLKYELNKPKFIEVDQEVIVGWHSYRLHLKNFYLNPCEGNSCKVKECFVGSLSCTTDFKEFLDKLQQAGFNYTGENRSIIVKNFTNKDGKEMISVNYKPEGIFTQKKAEQARVMFLAYGISGSVRGMFGAEKKITVKKKQRIQ